MSQHAQPVPPPPPPPPAGVIVPAPAAVASASAAAAAPAAPQHQPPAGAGQPCGAYACEPSPLAGPQPPALPSPPQLRANLQDSPLDLSAATASSHNRPQEVIQKVKVEHAKWKEERTLENCSNILRSQLNGHRDVGAVPTPEEDKMGIYDSNPAVTGSPQKWCQMASTAQYPEHTLPRAAATEAPGAGSQCWRMPHPTGGSPYRANVQSYANRHYAPLAMTPKSHRFSPLKPKPIREGCTTPIHVQIPSYRHGPVHETAASSYGSPLQNPEHGSAFTRHVRVASPLTGGRSSNSWAQGRDGDMRNADMLMQMLPNSRATPPLASPLLGRYSPDHSQGLATPHTSQAPPQPQWSSPSWMIDAPGSFQCTTPPQMSSGEAAGCTLPIPMPQVLQSQGKNVRPFKIFNYDELLGEPATPESSLGRLPFDTRENYERFLNEQLALLPSPSQGRRRAPSPPPEEHHPSPDETPEMAAYRARRLRNNLAAKKSRLARHDREDNISISAVFCCYTIRLYRHELGMARLLTRKLKRQLEAVYLQLYNKGILHLLQ
ncbi:trithorax group protein osa-like [Schistocerca gregaria]|uniref:trithorax group protein osa-like n=1 Tax=Schistocerca gregaria TaxID=7010 RepID=UPI00211EC3E8|nr:trithorax group protein osa-like [Schistocerca gregaria]